MRSTRIYLTIGVLAVSLLGVYWTVCAQEGPLWAPPTVVPTDERVPEKKTPLRVSAPPFNQKPKAADPSIIIPPAAYEKPRLLSGENRSEIVQTGGVTQVEPRQKDEKAPIPPALPTLIPEWTETKPLNAPDLPPPLPTPIIEPTKVLIGDPSANSGTPLLMPPGNVPIEEKRPLFPPPTVVMEPKQIPVVPPPLETSEKKKPTLLIAPTARNEEKPKSFVRIRPETAVAPASFPGPATPQLNDRAPPILPPKVSITPTPATPASSTSLLTLQTPTLTVEKRGGATPGRGDMHTYQIVIRNIGAIPGQNVRVDDELPAGAKLIAADPTPTMQGDKAVWLIPEIAVQREMTLQLTVLTSPGPAPKHQTGISVYATSQTHVAALPARNDVNPLTIQLLGPLKATVGKPVIMEVRVSNQSSRPISGIKLFGSLPEGLDTPEGRNIEGPEDGMVFQAGETKTLKMPANAVKQGRYTVRVKVAASAVEATDTAVIDITADTLLIQQAPQTKLLPNREGDLVIEVANNTGRTLRNVAVVDRLPDGLDFISANEAGLYQANSRTVYWTLKELPEGKRQSLSVRVHGAKPGQHRHIVTAKADGLAELSSTGLIILEGIADLTLRVVDRDGPAYVGREVHYEVHVQNRGLSADQNVQLQVQFPPGLTPKSAQGPMRHSLDKQTVVFEPIASVGPQGQALYRVSAVAQTPGDQRVRFAIVSAQVRNPIQREISTMVYRD